MSNAQYLRTSESWFPGKLIYRHESTKPLPALRQSQRNEKETARIFLDTVIRFGPKNRILR